MLIINLIIISQNKYILVKLTAITFCIYSNLVQVLQILKKQKVLWVGLFNFSRLEGLKCLLSN